MAEPALDTAAKARARARAHHIAVVFSSQPTEQRERREMNEKQGQEAELWRRFVWEEGAVLIYPPEGSAGSKQGQPKSKTTQGKGASGAA